MIFMGQKENAAVHFKPQISIIFETMRHHGLSRACDVFPGIP
jgi:hypothetical protein